MKKILSLLLTVVVFAVGINIAYAAELPLKDIDKHWAKDNIMLLYNQRLIGGYPDGTYKPNEPVNLVEFLKLATLGIGYKLESGHKIWYENYLNKALEIGLIEEGEYLDPTAPITREDIAKIAVKAVLQNEEKPLQELDDMITMNIRDFFKVKDENKQYIIDAYRIGLMTGNPQNLFEPQDTLTRAEMCTVIIRLMDKTKRQPFTEEDNIAIKINNIYSGQPYVICRPEKLEEIGLVKVMQEALSKDKGWYFVSYYPDNFGIGFYDSEEQFKTNEFESAIGFTTHLNRNDNNLGATYSINVRNPQKAKDLHREPIAEAFKYLFGQDYQKAMNIYDQYLEEDLNGTAKPIDINYTIANRKVNIYRDNSAGFVFNIYKNEQ